MRNFVNTIVVALGISATLVGFLWVAISLSMLVASTMGALAGYLTSLFFIIFVIIFCATWKVN